MTPQALAVKIFALMPVSMVEERAVSVTTWINSAKRSRQSVATVSNHLQIRQFEQSHGDVQNVLSLSIISKSFISNVFDFFSQQDRRKKPVSIRWREMQSTIHKPRKPEMNPVALETEISGDEFSDLVAEDRIDPADGLQWLDDNLPPELKNIEHCNFLIADTFDITSAFLLDILGDENVEANTSQAKTVQTDSGKGKAKAVSYQPQDDEWSTF